MATVTRRRVLGVLATGVGGLAVTGQVSATGGSASSVQITAYSLPDHIDPEKSFTAIATVENEGSETADVGVGYYFDNAEIEVTYPDIEAGSTVDAEFKITPGELQEFFGGSIEPGDYRHGFGVFEGSKFHDFVEETTTYGDPSGGESTDDSQSTVTASPAQTQSEPEGGGTTTEAATTAEATATPELEENSRGFFSNTGSEPDYLSDTFNLTVFGFLLSAFGLIHQMIGGR